MRSATSEPICVTGAGGYIAGFVVKELLEKGYVVHGTVRDPENPKNAFLKHIANTPECRSGTLKLFAADLSNEGSFDDAIAGCPVVVHMAAVVQQHFEKDPWKEVISPTVDGVKNVVRSCLKLNVRRLVYTSSSGTIACREDLRKPERRGKPFTEDEWLTHVSPTYGTYNFAKIEAEKALQEMWGDREVVSLLPSWNIGPMLNGLVTGSQQMMKMILKKELGNLFIPRMYIHWVDVRDVAAAHVFAVEKSDLPSGRYNCAGLENVSLQQVAEIMNRIDPSVAVPTRMTPYIVLWCMSWKETRLTKHYLAEKTVQQQPLDSSKLERAGFTFRFRGSLEDTLRETVKAYRKYGVI